MVHLNRLGGEKLRDMVRRTYAVLAPISRHRAASADMQRAVSVVFLFAPCSGESCGMILQSCDQMRWGAGYCRDDVSSVAGTVVEAGGGSGGERAFRSIEA